MPSEVAAECHFFALRIVLYSFFVLHMLLYRRGFERKAVVGDARHGS